MSFRFVAAVLFCLCIFPTFAPIAVAADYPAPEGYLQDGRYIAYQEAAQAYLKNNPDALDAPRVAMDLMQAATVLNDPPTIYKMRRLLLLNYTSSVQGKYVMLQFRDAADFGQMMYEIFAESVESMPPGFPAKYDGAMHAGMKRFGGITGSSEFIVFDIAMAHEVADKDLEAAATEILANAGERGANSLALAMALVDDKTPLHDRIVKLHAMTNRAAIIPFERFLINKMSDEEKSRPVVLRAIADNFLYQRRLDDALPALEKIPGIENDARFSFWRAAAIAAAGDNARAASMLGDIAAKFPDDPWGKQAAMLQPIVAQIDHTITTQADDMLAMLGHIRPVLGHMEMNATYEREDHSLSSIYCGLFAGARFELSASKGGVVQVGCKSTASDAAYYFGTEIPGVNSDGEIHKYSMPGVVLAPALHWDGSNLRVVPNARFMRVPGDLVTAIDELLKLPMFQNRDSMLDWLRQNVHTGRFPMPATGDAIKTYAWLTPDPMEPAISRLEYSIDDKNLTLTFSDGGFKISSMHFATADNFDLKPPDWPAEKKETNEAKIEQGVASAVMPAIQALLFGVPPASTQPSTTQP